MYVLDLFCGTKSLRGPCEELGFNYFGIDYDSRFNPDLVADINTLSVDSIPFPPDIVWASPPCEHFSVASMGHHWNKDGTPKTKEAAESQRLVISTLALIKKLSPKYFFIENPRGKLRKQEFMQNLPIRHTVTYCQYGDFRMKPTDIWTNNSNWVPKPMCHNGDPCHVASPRGSRTGTQGIKTYADRGRVPYNLLIEVLQSCTKGKNNASTQ